MDARSLREGLPPLDLATIKDFFRFIVATSRVIIDDGQKKVTINSMNILRSGSLLDLLE
jgi:hypothetical protein